MSVVTFLVIYLAEILISEAAKRPHIIIFLADDLGHYDVGFHGSKQIPTPNIDALAYDGVVLNNYYVQRICTPSRAALMTGRHPTQLGLQHGVIMAAEKYGLGLNETLLPEYLRKMGYSTNMVGKWHLGLFAKEYTPVYRGFDHFYGFLQGRQDYYDHTFKDGDYWGYDLRNDMNLVKAEFGQYGTEILTTEAVRIIENHDPDKPLFLYFPQQGVHVGNEETATPLEAPWKYVKKFSHIGHKQRRIYAGMVSAVDDSIGNVTRALHAKGMLNDSVIVFSTDNGGPAAGFDKNQACNWPLRGMKFTLWEGGVRGAAFIWSPLLNKSGYVSRRQMQIEDFFPTLLHAAGYDTTSLPDYLYGMDLWDMLSSDGEDVRKEMFYNSDRQTGVKAVREGDMKLIMSGSHGITAAMDGWYSPPQYEVIQQLSSGANKNSFERDHFVSLEELEWFKSPDIFSTDYEAQEESADPDFFETDLCDILTAIGRPARASSPVVVKCGPPPRNLTNCVVSKKPCLFNVTADPCEFHNLADAHPETVETLLKKLAYYEEMAVPPRNKPNDPKGFPKYHNGIVGPWVNLTQQELAGMKEGKITV